MIRHPYSGQEVDGSINTEGIENRSIRLCKPTILNKNGRPYKWHSSALLHSVLEVPKHGEVNLIELIWGWHNDFVRYLKIGELQNDSKASQALKTRAAKIFLLEGSLYRRTYLGPLPKCLKQGETDYVTSEIHKGVCDNNSGADSLILKMIREGYYWP